MSVINKMLQDLEKREANSSPINADYQPPTKKPSQTRVIILLLVAVSAIVYALLSNSNFLGVDETTQTPIQQEQKLQQQAKVETSGSAKKMAVVEPSIKVQQAPVAPVVIQEKPVIPPALQHIAETEVEYNEPAQEIILPEQSVVPEARPIVEPLAAVETVQTPIKEPATFKMSGSGRNKQLQELKQNISENLAAGNLTYASAFLQRLLQLEKDNISARKKLASIKFSQGNYVQAKLLLTDGIEMFPQRADFKMMLARIHVAQGQKIEAMDLLKGFQPQNDSEDFLAYRAGLARELKQPETAKADYLVLTRIAPNNGKWWLGLAIVEDQIGHTESALQAYEKAKQSNQLENVVNAFVEQRIKILMGAK
ncbi:tetratricopeptide repeat protein [Paraglaciecola aquimarina]|uniref:Tetratricopeptide repeat protein n=1 Tax=Paraglaciecola aquimarina TaxID=1235557 RepID=A0ABU3ST12_9ALTE|nr:tetratricopeptide repeat protein [Paraglaciecola aquimarina]MDU0353124.1 tetratricopeptide repeat protein [Paraglaciecola aquimarina]